MGILQDVVLTTDQKQMQVSIQVRNLVKMQFIQAVNNIKNLDEIIYNNPQGLTLSETLASFGTDAAELVRIIGLRRDALNNIAPETLPTSMLDSLVIHADGTVTVQS